MNKWLGKSNHEINSIGKPSSVSPSVTSLSSSSVFLLLHSQSAWPQRHCDSPHGGRGQHPCDRQERQNRHAPWLAHSPLSTFLFRDCSIRLIEFVLLRKYWGTKLFPPPTPNAPSPFPSLPLTLSPRSHLLLSLSLSPMWCSLLGSRDIVALLIEAGANIQATDETTTLPSTLVRRHTLPQLSKLSFSHFQIVYLAVSPPQ